MRVLVVAGSPEVASAGVLRGASERCDHIVAADRGLDALLAAGLGCDVFCGDADTVSAAGRALVDRALLEGAPFEVERFDPRKDATDLALVLRAVAARWPGSDIVATCCSGGKPDMALSVLGLLAGWGEGAVEIVEDAFAARMLRAGEHWVIYGGIDQRFSIVALAPDTVVSERGLAWELDHAVLPLLGDLGISNYITAPMAHISCHSGNAIAYLFNEPSPLAPQN